MRQRTFPAQVDGDPLLGALPQLLWAVRERCEKDLRQRSISEGDKLSAWEFLRYLEGLDDADEGTAHC